MIKEVKILKFRFNENTFNTNEGEINGIVTDVNN